MKYACFVLMLVSHFTATYTDALSVEGEHLSFMAISIGAMLLTIKDGKG